MLHDITQWFADLFVKVFTALFGLLEDAAISIAAALFHAIGVVIAAIPVPDFMSGGLSAFWIAMPSAMIYLLSACGAPQALAIIGAGYVFRLARKAATLFQW